MRPDRPIVSEEFARSIRRKLVIDPGQITVNVGPLLQLLGVVSAVPNMDTGELIIELFEGIEQ